MDCLNTNCNITNADRMISCWLCLGSYHIKCTALKPRDADSLADPGKSLQWTCPCCKKINVNFYKFFKSYKDEFEHLQNDFLSLQAKLSKFGELYTNFPILEDFVNTSPKRKRTKNKSPAKLTVPTPPINTLPSSDNMAPLNIHTSSSLQNSVSDVHDAPSNNPTTSSSTNAYPSNNPNYADVVNNGNNVNSHRELRVVPPRKQIFISRFAFDTSADDIDYYIKSKLSEHVDVTVHKFTYSQARSITSFKITVPFHIFENVVNPSFWPDHVLVREYEYNINQRSNNIAHLPPRQQTVQKN